MKRLALLLIIVRGLVAQTSSPCDLNADGSVNVVDVQTAVNGALGISGCIADLNGDGKCDVVDVQRVITAALGGSCQSSAVLSSGSNAINLYEVDSLNQPSRPVTIGRVFAQGEIAQCVRPVVGGAPVASYQADVKNRWPDGSVKFAVISFVQTLSSGSATTISFQNTASCNNSGFLTQTQMTNFNGGGWGADIEVTANGTKKTADAKTMLAALGFQECELTYWLQGPVVTQVIVQDCTATSAYDFGWTWNGTIMSSPVAGNAATASLHPIFILSFYPSTNSVKVDYILENNWVSRQQDQQYSVVLKAGNPLAQVYSKGLFTHSSKSRWRKTFWSGGAPKHIRIDHNFPYLIATKALPNYDRSATVDPSANYTAFAAGDKGDIGGLALAAQWPTPGGFSDDNEGAPLQREDLEYLYNMGLDCGTPNGKCAKAWNILTGEADANPATTLAGVQGGGGMWNVWGQVPVHYRESRTGGRNFYCPEMDSKNATADNKTCTTGLGTAVGKPFSRHFDTYFPIYGNGIVTPVGTSSNGRWNVGGCDHWLDYAYVPYLLTGDHFFLEEEYFAASYCTGMNPVGGPWNSNSFFAYINPSFYSVTRNFAWGIQSVGRAAFIAPDTAPDGSASPEALYYRSVVKSNMEVQEGFMNITGTALTPASTHPTCAGVTAGTANRWDWGRCIVNQGLSNGLHSITGGECPLNSGFNDATKTTDTETLWQYWFAQIALSHLKELGLSEVSPVVTQMWQREIEMVVDPTFNPYLVAAVYLPLKNGAGACNLGLGGPVGETANPYLTTWAQVKAAFPASVQNINTFDHSAAPDPPWQNFACADHGYSLVARAAGTYIKPASSGSLSGSAAWTWLNANVPYFSTCGDSVIKFALSPR